MPVPLLHRQLQVQLSQWIHPQDQRHLQVFSENVAAILQAQSACLSHWLPYLSHRDCVARSHMERLNYFVHNPKINAETFYVPLLRQFLQGWEGTAMTLTLDTSVLWDQYCLIEVCLIWGGRSIPLSQTVLEHGSATVGYEDYRPVLEHTLKLLPPGCQVMLLADRGFEHGAFIRWLRDHRWSWTIRAKSDLNITLSQGQTQAVADLLPPKSEAYLFRDVTILQDIECHLATAHLAMAGEAWAVLTDVPPSLQTFEVYGQRFGGIEPHFKDYKSAAFELIRSHLRDAQALSCLLMLLAAATLIAISLAVIVVSLGRRKALDWHSHRGLSFLQLGLREIKRLCYQRLPLPSLAILPRRSPPPASASLKKREYLETRIEFSRVTVFST
ncbi:transposase [Nostoc sp. CCY0012]|uniref:transposase n=1 Tax=Nostoc sp. CCY0012 TaxID=1056123 RepID=UPI0039C6E9BB